MIQPNDKVVLSHVDSVEPDPVLGQFLDFLAHDIQDNPQHLNCLSTHLINRIQSLVANVEVDLDAQLLDKDE
jgi:antitoxin PrlF